MPGYFAAMQNKLYKTTNFDGIFLYAKYGILQASKFY